MKLLHFLWTNRLLLEIKLLLAILYQQLFLLVFLYKCLHLYADLHYTTFA
jgi:hypothetical protein